MTRRTGAWGQVKRVSRTTKHGGTTTFYQAKYVDPKSAGLHYVTKSFAQHREAEAWLCREQRLVQAYEHGEADWTSPRERERQRRAEEARRKTTYADVAARFLSTVVKPDGTAEEESSMRKLTNDVRHTLDAEWRDMPIADITRAMITRWINDHRHIGPYAVHNAVAAMKRVLNMAVEEGLLDRSPAEYVKTPRKPAVSKQSLIPVATPVENQAIIGAMPDYTRAAACIAIGCGLRISEICGLRVEDIDLRMGTVTVRHAVGRGKGDRGYLRLKAPKNRTSYRTVPIPSAFLPEVRRHLSTRPRDPKAMLFTGARSTVLPMSTLRRHFDEARKAANREDLHFHTLRAGYDTGILHEGGAELPETMHMAGHSAVTVEALYQRADPARMRRSADRWGSFVMQSQVRTREDVEHDIVNARSRLRSLEEELSRLTD